MTSREPAIDPTELERVRERASRRDVPRWMRLDALYALRAGVSAPLAIALLLIANAIPLVGVVFLGWDLFAILVLYWIESGIVGALNIAKMAMAGTGKMPANVTVRGGNMTSLTGMKAFAIPFFVMHYGIFWVVHGVFVLFGLPLMTGAFGGGGFSGSLGSPLDAFRSLPLVALGAVGLTASHLVSFLVNYIGRREYERTNPISQMLAPYARVFVLHFTIVLGAVVVGLLGSPIALLLILVAVKTLIDLGLHLAEHLRLARGRGTRDGPVGEVTIG